MLDHISPARYVSIVFGRYMIPVCYVFIVFRSYSAHAPPVGKIKPSGHRFKQKGNSSAAKLALALKL